MAFQIPPGLGLLSLENVKFQIHHGEPYILPDNPELDDIHIHNSFEFYLNLSGDVSFLVENKVYPIISGDLIITRPGEMHRCIYHSPGVHKFFCLWCEVPEKSFLHDYLNQQISGNFQCSDERIKQKLTDLLYNLYKLSRENNAEPERTVCFLQILMMLVERSEQNKVKLTPLPGELQRMLDYIDEHFFEIQHINEIFDLFFISPSTVNRLFRKYIHLSPHKYLESRKLAYAQQLLTRGLTVSQVCLQCGFSDCSRFISVFKKRFGETPYRYKTSRKISD